MHLGTYGKLEKQIYIFSLYVLGGRHIIYILLFLNLYGLGRVLI